MGPGAIHRALRPLVGFTLAFTGAQSESRRRLPMKKLLSLLLAATLASAAFAADAVPLFNATLAIGKEHRFVLMSAAGKASSFLKVGESFEGYKLKDYDAKTGELTLEKDGKATKVTLMADATNTGPAASASATPATVADATAFLNKMNFEEMMDRIMVGVRRQQAGAMGQMTRGALPPDADQETKDAFVAFQKKLVDAMMGDVTGASMKDEVAKIYSEVFSKEQMDALGAFYQTPTGAAMLDKQPEVSEKMNAIMMQRIMSNMPKVQQLSQEFRAEMKAKKAGDGATPPPAVMPQPKP
jgi:hypothetical protein